MRTIHACAFVGVMSLAVWGLGQSTGAQSSPVSIQFQNGFVTLRAQNAPLRTILQEWARVGHTKIVDGDRVTGSAMTIELTNVPEQQALATLLRGVSGYIVGARQNASTGPSSFDRIMILPTSVNAAAAGRAVVNSTPPPPAPIAFVPGDADDGDLPTDPQGRVLSAVQLQNQINARTTAAQNPENAPAAPPPAAAQPATTPGYSGRSGRPGEVAPAPQRGAGPRTEP